MAEPTDRELIDAMNLLGQYAERLPPDYEIEVTMTSDEQCLRLLGPDNYQIDLYNSDIAVMRDAVETAHEYARGANDT